MPRSAISRTAAGTRCARSRRAWGGGVAAPGEARGRAGAASDAKEAAGMSGEKREGEAGSRTPSVQRGPWEGAGGRAIRVEEFGAFVSGQPARLDPPETGP